MRIPAILLTLLTLLTGCRAGTPVHIQVYQTDAGRSLSMEPGDTLEIVLDGNPTTGYQWTVQPWDTEVIKETEKPAYKSGSNAIGAGGQFIFHFTAHAPGQTCLKFIYSRPFEKDVPPVKTFQADIVVSKSTVPYS